MAFLANGKQYPFNTTLGNVRLTSKLEFWKYPDLMAQWPFAHEYEITQRLAGGSSRFE